MAPPSDAEESTVPYEPGTFQASLYSEFWTKSARSRHTEMLSRCISWGCHLLLICVFFLWPHGAAASIGVNWGTLGSHKLPSKTVVEMLRANGISKVKLFDADPGILAAFRGRSAELMIAVPNEMLQLVAAVPLAAQKWVRENVTRYMTPKNGVNIKYVAVGNEPFLQAYNGTYLNSTYPALKNIQDALVDAGLDAKVKATVPLNGDVLSNGNSAVPSGGIFRPDVAEEVIKVIAALHEHGAPFTVNLYPFLSLQQDPNFPKDFAFFDGATKNTVLLDGNLTYTNVFDASYDLLVSALTKAGFPDMPIIVGEIGWPTDGDMNANAANAQRFNQALVRHVQSSTGTPLRRGPLQVYLFGLLDEDQKSILPGCFERHWGIFGYDGKAKYQLDLRRGTGGNGTLISAKNVRYLPRQWCVLNPDGDLSRLGDNVGYACSNADCSSLMYGSSCNDIGAEGNASYAFNSYYQLNDQVEMSCHFDGLAMVTKQSPSLGDCQFKVELATNGSVAGTAQERAVVGAGSLAFSSNLLAILVLQLLLLQH